MQACIFIAQHLELLHKRGCLKTKHTQKRQYVNKAECDIVYLFYILQGLQVLLTLMVYIKTAFCIFFRLFIKIAFLLRTLN